eukprot:gene5619-24586_t
MNGSYLNPITGPVLQNRPQLKHDAIVQKLKTRQRTEFAMAILEDLPELVIDAVFLADVAKSGDEEEALTTADIALFVFGALLSIYHICKCIWTFVKFRAILRADKEMTKDEAMATLATDAEEQYGF